ncbi:MAG: ABC transporter permease, partial [Oscillospiraceae bacterium]
DFGVSYTMQTILIVVLGGVNPDGGFGSIPGVAIAVVILQMISSYLNMFPNISNFYRDLIWGAALIAVLIINFVINKSKTKKLSKAS